MHKAVGKGFEPLNRVLARLTDPKSVAIGRSATPPVKVFPGSGGGVQTNPPDPSSPTVHPKNLVGKGQNHNFVGGLRQVTPKSGWLDLQSESIRLVFHSRIDKPV